MIILKNNKVDSKFKTWKEIRKVNERFFFNSYLKIDLVLPKFNRQSALDARQKGKK